MWRIVCLWILLVEILRDAVATSDNNVVETCKWETFRTNCSAGHVIFINSAHYGRIRRGRCAQMEATERPCNIDVLSYVDKQCGGRRSCDITLPTRHLDVMTSPCSKELNQYLEISYHCQEVYYAGDQRCIANQSVPVVSSVGYLANVITDETNKGSSVCPWKIQLQPGQTVHLTLLDFGVYRKVTAADKGTICHIYAVLKDSFVASDGPGTLVCGGDVRETLVLTSMAREVQISMKKLNSPPRDPIHFLIKYEVTGCTEFEKPEGSTVEIVSWGLRVTCRDPSLGTWDVRCANGKWDPAVNNHCVSPWSTSSNVPPGSASTFNAVFLVAGAAAAVLVSILSPLVAFIICVHCRRKNSATMKATARTETLGSEYDLMPYAITDAYDAIEEVNEAEGINFHRRRGQIPSPDFSGLTSVESRPPGVYSRMDNKKSTENNKVISVGVSSIETQTDQLLICQSCQKRMIRPESTNIFPREANGYSYIATEGDDYLEAREEFFPSNTDKVVETIQEEHSGSNQTQMCGYTAYLELLTEGDTGIAEESEETPSDYLQVREESLPSNSTDNFGESIQNDNSVRKPIPDSKDQAKFVTSNESEIEEESDEIPSQYLKMTENALQLSSNNNVYETIQREESSRDTILESSKYDKLVRKSDANIAEDNDEIPSDYLTTFDRRPQFSS